MEGERVFINCTALSYVEPKNVNHELECFIRVRVNVLYNLETKEVVKDKEFMLKLRKGEQWLQLHTSCPGSNFKYSPLMVMLAPGLIGMLISPEALHTLSM